jgi:serine/threonine protein phosphatase PrpC
LATVKTFPASLLIAASTSTLIVCNNGNILTKITATNDNNMNVAYDGQIFYPQDIYENADVKEALWTLCCRERKDHLHLTNNDKKKLEALQSCGNQEVATLTCVGSKDRAPKYQINQDRAVAISPFHIGQDNKQQQEDAPTTISSRLIAVFDGHSKHGEKISQYAATQLPMVLAMKLDQIQRTDHDKNEETNLVKNALIDTFIEIDRTCPGQDGGGCTASVVLQRGSKVYVANAGDSLSFVVVYRPTHPKTVEIIYMSREDKPVLRDERKRLEEFGGTFNRPNHGGDTYVLYKVGWETYGLAMSRSIGDWEARKVGVIPDPIVDVIDIDQVVKACKLQGSDGTANAAGFIRSDDVHIFAVSATDGMTKFVSPKTIAQAVAPSLYDDDAPYLLSTLRELINSAQCACDGYKDDVTVSVTDIRRPPVTPSKQE